VEHAAGSRIVLRRALAAVERRRAAQTTPPRREGSYLHDMLATGALVHGRFRVVGPLGEGAHGAVYRAVDLAHAEAEEVALKVLHDDIAADESYRLRLIREAHAIGQLHGTCAVRVHALDQTPDGQLYLAMEYLEGMDLAAYVRHHEKQLGPLPVAEVLSMLGPVAATLQIAHAKGIVHRDVKPKNIFVCDDASRGRMRLLDFGLARDLGVSSMTSDGTVAGSPATIAPEVWLGRKDRDHRVDVYALGITVFRALGGCYPFDPRLPLARLLMEVTLAERPSLHARRPDLPAAVDGWVQRSLTIDPTYRFASVRDQWSALWDLLGATAGRSSQPPPSGARFR
jgi:serine/threonine-protein kinase